MNKFILLMSIFLLGSNNLIASADYIVANGERWNLVWEDNFEGNELDTSKWNIDTGNGFWSGNTWIDGWGNNESQYYTQREKNVRVENGRLVLTAHKERYTGEAAGRETTFEYTSGKVLTRDLFSKKYGRFEMRAKLPVGKGIWPALWMMPQDDVYGGWAASGEIDIVEGWGSRPDEIAGTLHYGSVWPANVHTGAEYKFTDSTVEEFHIYALEWVPGEIRWYVNGELYQVQNDWYSRNSNEAIDYKYPAPFDQEFFLIFNVAVGGWFDGEPDSTTKFPASMEVDYIRVYDLEGGYDEDVVRPMTTSVEELPANAKKAINGNFIHNGDFSSQGKDWELLSHFGGSARYSFEKLGDSNFLKANIQNSGNESYSIQVIQEAPIVKGNWYKLSFEAKADSERPFGIKIGAGEERGWIPYHTNTFVLSRELNSYSTLFQMINDTDLAGKVEFHGGLSDIDFHLGNVRLELIDDPETEIENMTKVPLLNGNLIYNGTFDQGFSSRMQFWNFSATDSVANVIDRELVVENKGDKARLVQKGIQLLANESYALRLKATSDTKQELKVKITSNDESKVYLNKNIAIDGEFKEFRLDFDSKLRDFDSKLIIEFSDKESIVKLDGINMRKLIDYSQIETTLIDEDFSNRREAVRDWTAWSGKEFGFGGEMRFSVSRGRGRLNVRDIGGEEWSNMFYQNVNLQKDIKYRLSFDISSSRDRDVRVVMENANYNRVAERLVQTSRNEQNVEIEFVAGRSEEVGLKFLLGNIGSTQNRPHDVFLNNVKLEVVKE